MLYIFTKIWVQSEWFQHRSDHINMTNVVWNAHDLTLVFERDLPLSQVCVYTHSHSLTAQSCVIWQARCEVQYFLHKYAFGCHESISQLSVNLSSCTQNRQNVVSPQLQFHSVILLCSESSSSTSDCLCQPAMPTPTELLNNHRLAKVSRCKASGLHRVASVEDGVDLGSLLYFFSITGGKKHAVLIYTVLMYI